MCTSERRDGAYAQDFEFYFLLRKQNITEHTEHTNLLLVVYDGESEQQVGCFSVWFGDFDCTPP
jgi:hypothetical protein